VERPISSSDKTPLLAHINLARGFRGGERQTELLVRGLADAGWRQSLIVRRGEALSRRCVGIAGVELRPVQGHVPGAALALRGATLVHVHEARALQAAWLGALAGGAPYLVTRRVQQGPSHSALNRAMYRRASRVVALSSAIAGALHALEPSLDVRIVPSASAGLPADDAVREALRGRFSAPLLVGHVGALVDSHKGQRQILAIARELASTHPGLAFVLVGSGRDEAALRAEAQGLGNVHFVGEVSDVGNWLAAFDLFLYPSRHEGLGSILLDAMSFGLPVVATRAGGIPEIVRDGAGGLLCEVDDVAGLAAAVMTLAADADLRERFAAHNRAQAAQYSPAVMIRRYDALYRELLTPLTRATSSK
jgi:glycosyltransferase involved in cell wall biosynthesis